MQNREFEGTGGLTISGRSLNQPARNFPVSVSQRAPDRQAPPPSCLSSQWPAGATPRRKSLTKRPWPIIDTENSQQKFVSGPRSLTDMGLECRLLGDKRTSNSGDWMSAFSRGC